MVNTTFRWAADSLSLANAVGSGRGNVVAEKGQLRAVALRAGLSVAELVRLRVLGRPVVSRTDATTIRELRRLGGLLKKVHVDSNGAYSERTAAALADLHRAIATLSEGRWGGKEPA